MKTTLRVLTCVFTAGFACASAAPVIFAADHNRDGQIDDTDFVPAGDSTNGAYSWGKFQRTGAVVWANLDFDEADEGSPARFDSTGKPLADAIRFYHDGITFEATHEDFTLRKGEQGWWSQLPGSALPAGAVRSPLPDVFPLKLKRLAGLAPTTRVLIEAGSAEQARAFHFYKRIPDFAAGGSEEKAVWGAYRGASPSSFDITKWVNESAPGYTGFATTRKKAADDFVFGIEGMLHKGMKHGFSASSKGGEFDGVVDLRVVSVDAAGARTVLGEVRLTLLRLPAFPGAEGFGRWAAGGRGGEVVKVTNLSDSTDPGSLRWAVKSRRKISGSQRWLPRTVVFEKSGLISLTDSLGISRGHLTLAGQTAPFSPAAKPASPKYAECPGDGRSPGGVTITGTNSGFAFRVQGSTSATGREIVEPGDVVIRFLRSRLATKGTSGGNHDGDAFTLQSASNVIIDHCSFGFSRDGTLDISQGDHPQHDQPEMSVTVQWSYLHHALLDHSKMMLLNGKDGARYSVLNCYLGHMEERAPRISRLKGAAKKDGGVLAEFINNAVHNWRSPADWNPLDRNPAGQVNPESRSVRYSLVQNYYQPGRNTLQLPIISGYRIFNDESPDGIRYASGNDIRGRWDLFGPGDSMNNIGAARERKQPFASEGVSITGSGTAQKRIKEHGGCTRGPQARDCIDAAYAREIDPGQSLDLTIMKNMAPTFPKSLAAYYPTLASTAPDTDADGMDDRWEVKHFGGKAALHWKDADGDGWTNLEEFLNKTSPVTPDDPLTESDAKVFGALHE